MEDGVTMDVKETLDEFGKPRFIISTNKMKADVVVYKSNDGFAHYKIKYTKGVTPQELSGAYTGVRNALEAAKKYINSMKMTKTQRRETYYEENH